MIHRTEILVPRSLQAVLLMRFQSALPSGTKILSADSFGSSAWSITARIVTETSNGSAGGYFMKVSLESWGKRNKIHNRDANQLQLHCSALRGIQAERSWKANSTR